MENILDNGIRRQDKCIREILEEMVLLGVIVMMMMVCSHALG